MIQPFRLWIWILALLAIRLLVAAILPVTTDEAYYAIWSSRLSWGYFDHPPMVALGALLREFFPPEFAANPLLTRLPVVLCASTIIPISIHAVARRLGAKQPSLAVFLFSASLAGLAGGLLLTPDAFMLVLWAVSLLAVIKLMDRMMGAKDHFPAIGAIVCGAFFGLGMLAKYTYALMPMIFTWMVLFSSTLRAVPLSRRAGVFALTAVTALLAFAPHLAWNARHQWVTFGFQLRHGFVGDHGNAPLEDGFQAPPAPSWLPYSRLDPRLTEFFASYDAALGKSAATTRPSTPRRVKGKIEKSAQWFWEYLTSQLAGPGLLTPVALFLAWRERGKRRRNRYGGGSDPALAMTRLAAWIPFGFFGLCAPFTKVEANWPAMGFAGVAILAALSPVLSKGDGKKSGISRPLLLAGLGNAVLILAIAAFAAWPGLRSVILARPDRISEETTGYAATADHVANRWKVPGPPLFVDKYQWTAMIKLHRPDASVQQIRGITRDSEFTRASKWQSVDRQAFRNLSRIAVLTSEGRPPRFEDFGPVAIEVLCVKADGLLIDLADARLDSPPACLRRLFLYSYRRFPF